MADTQIAQFEHLIGVAGPNGHIMQLLLASGSPRRTLLLSAAGLPHDVIVPDVDETRFTDEPPAEYVLRVAEDKANAVPRNPDTVVVAADTSVVLGGEVLGKPVDAADALTMLTTLSGISHAVLTGWTVLHRDQQRFGVAESWVKFHDRSEEEFRSYIERTQPFDKAGAYAIQGDDGWLIERVTGSRSNVMGLPLGDIVEAIADFGIERSTANSS